MKAHVDNACAPILAVLIDAGFITSYPHAWTKAGKASVRASKTSDDILLDAVNVISKTATRDFVIKQIGRYWTARAIDGNLQWINWHKRPDPARAAAEAGKSSRSSTKSDRAADAESRSSTHGRRTGRTGT